MKDTRESKILTCFVFSSLYLYAEFSIQPNFEYSRLLRWYLSDVFVIGIFTNLLLLCQKRFFIPYPLETILLLLIDYEFTEKTDLFDIVAYCIGYILLKLSFLLIDGRIRCIKY